MSKFIRPDFKKYDEDLKVGSGNNISEIYTSNGEGTAQMEYLSTHSQWFKK